MPFLYERRVGKNANLELGEKRGEVASIQRQKTSFCSSAKRLETFGAVRADFLMCGIGNEAYGFLTPPKGAIVSEALVPFGQARPFQTAYGRSGGAE